MIFFNGTVSRIHKRGRRTDRSRCGSPVFRFCQSPRRCVGYAFVRSIAGAKPSVGVTQASASGNCSETVASEAEIEVFFCPSTSDRV